MSTVPSRTVDCRVRSQSSLAHLAMISNLRALDFPVYPAPPLPRARQLTVLFVTAREGRRTAEAHQRLPPPRPCLHLPALCTTHAAHAAAPHVAKPARSPRPDASGRELTALASATRLVVLFILAIHPWPGIDISTAGTWQLSTPRRRLRLEVCTALPRPTASR